MQTPNSLEKSSLSLMGLGACVPRFGSLMPLPAAGHKTTPVWGKQLWRGRLIFVSHFPRLHFQLVDSTALDWSWWEVRGGTKPLTLGKTQKSRTRGHFSLRECPHWLHASLLDLASWRFLPLQIRPHTGEQISQHRTVLSCHGTWHGSPEPL